MRLGRVGVLRPRGQAAGLCLARGVKRVRIERQAGKVSATRVGGTLNRIQHGHAQACIPVIVIAGTTRFHDVYIYRWFTVGALTLVH